MLVLNRPEAAKLRLVCSSVKISDWLVATQWSKTVFLKSS
jgi:hypothetical protein